MEYLWTGPEGGPTLVLAPGAGAGMSSAWMNQVAEDLGASGLRVARFDFPYMQAGRKAPDKEPTLLRTWREVVAELQPAAIGGKSMGGRMASMVADELEIGKLVCLGYPFHPPGRPEKLRTAHLEMLRTPALIVQGVRDAFGNPDDVEGYRLSPAIRIHWVKGDHSLTGVALRQELVAEVAGFLRS